MELLDPLWIYGLGTIDALENNLLAQRSMQRTQGMQGMQKL